MTSKNCSKCRELKPPSEFYANKLSPDGQRPECINCGIEIKLRYKKTRTGLISLRYNSQKSTSRKRGHLPPDYSLSEFVSWSINREDFNKVFNKWVKGGYKTTDSPSPDRIDDCKPYTLGNLQWITWCENKEKSYIGRKNGVNYKNLREVVKMNLDGTFVSTYYSLAYAGRVNDVHATNILAACKRNNRTCAGYRWMYGLGIKIKNNEAA